MAGEIGIDRGLRQERHPIWARPTHWVSVEGLTQTSPVMGCPRTLVASGPSASVRMMVRDLVGVSD